MRHLQYLEIRNFKGFGDRTRIELDHPAVLVGPNPEGRKLSDFAEEFFRRLAGELGHAMLLRKRDLHRLVDFMDADAVAEEVSEKLELLAELFGGTSGPGEPAN